ncbi:MAG TPA: myxosortase-dependent metalloprotease, MXAN_2677/MXAN_2678 family [Myxococcaceae bacterium]|nr:myxosortase-dependent metalloprotease, MXAN_2677/MXAN_2678 family [Myxococcaceae bacterium]
MIGASLVVSLAIGICSDPYVRTRADNTICPAATTAHCLWWQGGSVVTFQQSATGNPATPDSPPNAVFDAVTRSWQSWQAIMNDCGSLTINEGPHTSDRTVGYNQGSPNNANVVLFRQRTCSVPPGDPCLTDSTCGNTYDCWDHDSNVIALTTTTYDKNSGRILDADIELNGRDQSVTTGFIFTTVDSPRCQVPAYNCVAADIQNTATHEFGHAIGLDHTGYRDPQNNNTPSTMSPTAAMGDLTKRRVDSGSRQFVCDVYPKGRAASQDCTVGTNPNPISRSGCSAAPGEPMLVLALAGLALRLFRKRRAHRIN